MDEMSTKQLKARELASFCAQLAFVTKAGVPMREGILIMCEDAEDQRTEGILRPVAEYLERGAPLHYALGQSGWFPEYLLHMIEIGQTAGRLEEVLLSLSEYYENNDRISRSIRSAVSYPLVMIVMMAAVILILVYNVLPIFQQVLQQLGGDLSGLSTSIMTFGSILAVAATAVVGLILFLLIVILLLRTFSGGRRLLQRLYASFFVTRGIARKTIAAQFASTMALMLSSGLDIDQALKSSYELIDNAPMKRKLIRIKQDLNTGIPFTEALTRSGILSGVNNRMVAVGFKTGSVDTAMKKIAQRYEEEVDEKVGGIISVIEPTLVAILSSIVGVIILAVMMPLMGIMSTIS